MSRPQKMSPAQRAEELRGAKPPNIPSIEQLPEELREMFTSIDLDFNKFLEGYQDYSSYLLSIVQPGLSDFIRERLNAGDIALCELDDNKPAVYCEKTGSGHVIVFHAGLRNFLYRVLRIAFAQSTESPDNDDILELARRLAEVFWWYQKTGNIFGPDYDINITGKIDASRIATFGECFLLAHEFGHIELAHVVTMVDAVPNPVQEELLADRIAFHILLKTASASENIMAQWPSVYCGIEAVLHVWGMLEDLGLCKETQGHPAASDRLSAIRIQMYQTLANADIWKTISAPAIKLGQLFIEATHIIDDSAEQDVYFQQAARKLTARILDLVNECVGGLYPDYTKFYKEAPSLISVGYPEVILRDVVSAIAHELSEKIHTLPIDLQTKIPDEWTANEKIKIKKARETYHRYKLLLGVSNQLGKPMKEKFLEILWG